MKASDLLQLARPQLAKLLCEGHSIDPAALDDTEYRGVSLGLPAFVDRMTWKTFKKVFHRDPGTGRLRGWNVRVQQTGLEPPFTPRQRNGALLDPSAYPGQSPSRRVLGRYIRRGNP